MAKSKFHASATVCFALCGLFSSSDSSAQPSSGGASLEKAIVNSADDRPGESNSLPPPRKEINTCISNPVGCSISVGPGEPSVTTLPIGPVPKCCKKSSPLNGE
jgi:hypothetical protein